MNLFLNKEIYSFPNLSVYGISVYTALMSLITNEEMYKVCTTPEILCYRLTGTMNNPRRLIDSIRIGLEELLSNSYIIIQEKSKRHYVLDCSKLFLDIEKDFFTVITYKEVLKIFQIKNKNSFLLLSYFIHLMGTISSSIDVWVDAYQHKNRVVGNLTIDYLADLSGISERSVIEYNKILENAGILYIYRQKDFLVNQQSGEITTLPNVYGRPLDKMYVDAFALNQQKNRESYKWINNNIKKTNTKRRLAQMFIQLSKGNGEKYSKDDCLEIYKYVISENKKYENMYKKNGKKQYLKKIRDISIFNKYNFVPKEEEESN